MAIHIDIHPDDEQELARIRQELIGHREEVRMSQREVARQAGRSDKWINELERGIGHPFLSSLQDWASVFALRVQPDLKLPYVAGKWVPEEVDKELCFLWKQARAFEADPWVRLWCVSELKWERYWRGISAAEMSRRMGLSVSAISAWERDGNNPLTSKLFAYARALGGVMQFRLVNRSYWGEG